MNRIALVVLMVALAGCRSHEKPKDAPVAAGTLVQVGDGDTTITVSDGDSTGREPAPPKQLVNGMPCAGNWSGLSLSFGNGTIKYLDNAQHVLGEAPVGQSWSCKDGKWFRDLEGEKQERDRNATVGIVVDQITKRKLSKKEIGLINYARKDQWESCYGNGCFEREQCSTEAIFTADLMAQLSFWKPTEEELPLHFLQSFVKGMACDNEGTTRVYSVMNQRIVDWLNKKAKGDGDGQN